MGFAVFHIEKITTGASSLGAHIDRSPGQEHTYKNADPERLKQNDHLPCGKFNTMKLNEAIDLRIKTAYKGTRAIRKDAVKGMSIVLTGSHDQMKHIFSNENSRNAWMNENIKFIKEEFGGENVVRFTLHMDEKTPHVHAVVVPLTKDGLLSAKKIMGDRTAMSERQTRYADKMKPFGLERGVIGSKAIHNSEGWYLGHQKKEQEAILSQIPPLTFLDKISPVNYINKITEGLKLAVKQKKDAEMIAHSRTENLKVVNGLLEINKKAAEKDLQKVKQDLSQSQLQFKATAKVVLNVKLSPEEETYISSLKKEYEKTTQQNQIKSDLTNNTKNRGFKR